MSNLLKLKEWITLGDAAKYMSNLWAEDVSEADILRFALDERLVLSVVFGTSAYAKKLVPIDESEARWETLRRDDGTTFKIPTGGTVDFRSQWYKRVPEVDAINCGPWDLAMDEGVPLDVLSRLSQLTSEPAGYERGSYVYVMSIHGDLYLLQRHIEFDRFGSRGERPYWHADNFSDSSRLPEVHTLVIRTKVLQDFMDATSNSPKKQDTALGSRERTSYLNIIGALLVLVMNPRPGRSCQNDVIDELLVNYADKPGISKSNLEDKFASANKSLQR